MSSQTELWRREFVHHPAPSFLCKYNGLIHTTNEAGKSLVGTLSVNSTLQSVFGTAAISIQNIFSQLKEGVITTHWIVFQHQVYQSEIQFLGDDVWIRLCTQEKEGHQEKLRNLGALSGGLFHAIRNPLTIVQGRVELMQMMTTDERTQSTLQIVYDQCARIAEMLDNTQQITLQPVQQTQFSLNRLLRKVFMDKNIDVEHIELPAVSVLNDEIRLRIALRLIADRIIQSGAVNDISIHRQSAQIICTFQCDLDDDGLRFFKDVQNTVRTEQSVQFTSSTREQHIQMLGVIFADCAVDFQVSNTGDISITFVNVEQEIGNLKILVVDDDDILRETVVALLSLQGHHILTANTAEEAKLLWDELIDVVLLDVNLPKMSGVDLLDEIQTEHPTWVKRIILISGIGNFGIPSGVRFLQKPFSKRQLNEAIEQIMHQ